MNTQNKKLMHIEILRIIAAFFVIFNHTGIYGFSLFTHYPPDTLMHWVSLVFTVICKVSVPLFFMISGALLLRKEEESFKKQAFRFLKILAALVLFSLLAYLLMLLKNQEAFSLLHFLKILVTSSWMGPYWYLYAYLAFLLTLPFLRRLANAMKNKEFQYMLLLVFVLTGILPVLSALFTGKELALNPNFSIGWIAANIVFFPLAGFYLENRLDAGKIKSRTLALLWAATLLCLILTCIVTSADTLRSGTFTQNYLFSLIPVPCITAYLSLRLLCRKHPPGKRTETFLLTAGSCTYGIYLLHGFAIGWTQELIPKLLPGFFQSLPLIAELLYCLAVMIVSGAAAWILKRIPGIRVLL